MFWSIIAIIADLLRALVSYFTSKPSGGEEVIKEVEKKNEIDAKIDSLSDADAIERLRDKWKR